MKFAPNLLPPHAFWKVCRKEGRMHCFPLPEHNFASLSHTSQRLCMGPSCCINQKFTWFTIMIKCASQLLSLLGIIILGHFADIIEFWLRWRPGLTKLSIRDCELRELGLSHFPLFLCESPDSHIYTMLSLHLTLHAFILCSSCTPGADLGGLLGLKPPSPRLPP